MVAAGLGVSIIPTLNLPDQPDGVTTRPLDPRLPRTLALALGAEVGPTARAFIDERHDQAIAGAGDEFSTPGL